ncbi:FHA domain-containing protein, partial [Escherichia coli]|nr:FHA domain-containing protein [Escherichia coli]
FILSAVSVIRSDMFGKTVQASEVPQQLETVKPGRRTRRQRNRPTRLVLTNGPNEGFAADLSGGVVIIGRSSDCGIILDDDYVSTRHAQVLADGQGGYYVEDLGSTNGTYVNGRRISAATTVTTAESIRIGRTVLQ